MLVALVPRNLESWYLNLLRLNYLTFYVAVLLQIMVLIGSISVSLHTSDIMFAVRSRKSWSCMHIKLPFLQLILYWISNFLPQVKMLVDCMFSQPYQSFIKSENCWLYNSNPNFVIESTVNQFETPVRVDKSARHFSLSFFSGC